VNDARHVNSFRFPPDLSKLESVILKFGSYGGPSLMTGWPDRSRLHHLELPLAKGETEIRSDQMPALKKFSATKYVKGAKLDLSGCNTQHMSLSLRGCTKDIVMPAADVPLGLVTIDQKSLSCPGIRAVIPKLQYLHFIVADQEDISHLSNAIQLEGKSTSERFTSERLVSFKVRAPYYKSLAFGHCLQLQHLWLFYIRAELRAENFPCLESVRINQSDSLAINGNFRLLRSLALVSVTLEKTMDFRAPELRELKLMDVKNASKIPVDTSVFPKLLVATLDTCHGSGRSSETGDMMSSSLPPDSGISGSCPSLFLKLNGRRNTAEDVANLNTLHPDWLINLWDPETPIIPEKMEYEN